jgi:hypothetical protein
MAFEIFRLPPADEATPQVFVGFTPLSAVDPASGRTTMYLAVVATGSDCTPPDPPISLRVGSANAVPLVPGQTVPVEGPAGTAGRARLSGSGVQLVEIEVLGASSGWQIELGGPTGGVAVVADTVADVRQAWIDAPTSLDFAAEVGQTVKKTLTIANRGTGPLRIDNPLGTLGAGFTLADVAPRLVAPNTCAVASVVFAAPGQPGVSAGTLQVTGNDPTASTASGHNSAVALSGTATRPLWAPGDMIFGDVADGSATGVLYRIRPTVGQSVVATGEHLVSPMGMAFDADGNLLVADGGPGDAPGWLVRIDRLTGAQSVVSSGDGFVSPAGVAVAADGTIVIADAGPFDGAGSVIKVHPTTGVQTPVTSGDLLQNPCDLVLVGDTIIVLRGDQLGGGGGVVRVDPAGAQSVVSVKGLFRDPSLRPKALAREPSGTLLVAETSGPNGGVLLINPVSGTQQQLGALHGRPVGIAVSPDGRILVTSEPGPAGAPVGVLEIDRVNGQATPISTDGLFRRPRRLVVVA